MKFSAALVAILAAAAEASSPHRLHFRRGNDTAPTSTQSKVVLSTGGSPSMTIITTSKYLTMTLGTGTDASVVTSIPIQVTTYITKPVADMPVTKGSVPGYGATSTMTTSTSFTVISMKRPTAVPGSGAAAAGSNGNGSPGSNSNGNPGCAACQCSPSTVYVTVAASTTTVFLRAPTNADKGKGKGKGSGDSASQQPTVLPYPSGNSTRTSGIAGPSGAARLSY